MRIRPTQRPRLGTGLSKLCSFPPSDPFMIICLWTQGQKSIQRIIKEKVIPVAQRLGSWNHLRENQTNSLVGKDNGLPWVDYSPKSLVFTYWMNHLATWMQIYAHPCGINWQNSISEYQKTTLFVTHDQVEAMTLGQRLCVMNQGNIIQVGTPDRNL